MSVHYAQHIDTLQKRAAKVLEEQDLEVLLIHSGQLHMQFLSDQSYPFKANPHFKHWLPLFAHPNCWLIINGRSKPVLIFFQPVDFWHKVPDVPTAFWADYFDIVCMTSLDELGELLPSGRRRMAFIGEAISLAETLGIGEINPDAVINYLHYQRSYKTEYELECLRKASKIGVAGHIAACEAFYEGESEFTINQRYLAAVQQNENEIPYGNIVAINEGAAILHYTALQKQPKHTDELRSFLIDAGASHNGYASDITRTYSYREDEFAELISALNEHQLILIDSIKVGMQYQDLHFEMHRRIGSILGDFDFIEMSVDEAVESGVTRTFFPHGLGHFLGLQVHDVAGFMQNETGEHLAAPEDHPFLRCTRQMEAGQVFTIEPGLYFIPSLLAKLNARQPSKINWQKVDAFLPYGGIRIEDDIVMHASHIENMTRNAGLG